MNFILYEIRNNLLFMETLVLFTHIECSTASLIVVWYITSLLQHLAYGIMPFVFYSYVICT